MVNANEKVAESQGRAGDSHHQQPVQVRWVLKKLVMAL